MAKGYGFINGFVPILVFCFSILIIQGCRQNVTEDAERNMVIQIANTKLIEMGVNIEDNYIHYDYGNFVWGREFFNLCKEAPEIAEKFKFLKKQEYQTVIYSPKDTLTLGGVFWVFVDPNNKNVIEVYVEQ